MLSNMVEQKFLVSDLVKKEVSRSPSFKNTLSKVKTRVVACEDLRRGCCSQPFGICDIVTMCRNTHDVNDVFVKISENGLMETVPKKEFAGREFYWQGCLNLAPDVHSSNVHMEILLRENGDRHQVRFNLQVTKNVDIGGELLMWFSEEILATIDMPFLTPKNIAGHKKYRCHVCEENFEYPNPLKVHLLLSCGRESMSQLWNKIERSICNQYVPLNLQAPSRSSECQIINSVERPHSVSIPPLIAKAISSSPRCISEPPTSAFSPYKKNKLTNVLMRKDFKIQKEITHQLSPIQPLNLTIGNQSTIPDSLHRISDPQQPWMNNVLEVRLSRSLEELSGNYAADVELFASNWGKMKQGHLCVYCGKVYSRKYGLKIHIRTHTGYKPLKCKYCLRPFGDPSNLNKHVRLHATGLTPYMCGLCGKMLVRRRDLDRHLKSQHSQEDECLVKEST